MQALLSRIRSLAFSRPAARRMATGSGARAGGRAGPLSIDIDANGSPVTLAEADWFVCFVPGLERQWWHRFANARHKHVFAIRALDEATWLLVEPWWTRLMVNVLTFDEAIKFLRWGDAGDILKVRESIPGRGSQARGWSNCSVLVSFMLGRSYWTWTPHGLYRCLQAEAGVERVDLPKFLADHFRMMACRNAAAFESHTRARAQSLDEELQGLGTTVMTAMMSSSAIGLYKAAVSEASRFADAANAHWTSGAGAAIDSIRDLLDEAMRRQEIRVDDCAVAARQFASMLRGDLHMEIVFGLRGLPSPVEIRAHVLSVVALFLRGACRAGSGSLLRVAEPE